MGGVVRTRGREFGKGWAAKLLDKLLEDRRAGKPIISLLEGGNGGVRGNTTGGWRNREGFGCELI